MPSEIYELIKNRRSVKNFLSKEVPKDVLKKILEAAVWAPSAHNAQPWRFIVITDDETKRRLAEAMAQEWRKDLIKDGISPDIRKVLLKSSIEHFTKTPVLIIAAITMREMDKYPDRRRQEFEHLMATQSLAAAIQNMLLMARSEGLGSCWFCAPLFCQDTVRKILGIPGDVEPQALVTIGYPSSWPDPPPRKPLEEVVFKDHWGGRF